MLKIRLINEGIKERLICEITSNITKKSSQPSYGTYYTCSDGYLICRDTNEAVSLNPMVVGLEGQQEVMPHVASRSRVPQSELGHLVQGIPRGHAML